VSKQLARRLLFSRIVAVSLYSNYFGPLNYLNYFGPCLNG